MIFRPKLDNGAARGDDEKMQARTKAARALDRALGAAMLWGLSFLWFATRLGALWPAAALAAALTALAAYALHLYRRRRSRRLDAERARAGQRRAAVYRLTMLPEKTALCQAAEALARAYALTPAGARASVRLFTDAKGRRIAAGLHQSPQPADVREVHDFHRARGEDHGVLICAGGATEAAKSYAGRLEPPLRLLEAERLPLPDPPKCDAPRAAAKKGPAAVLARLPGEERAPRCLLLAALLMIAYILLDARSCLLAALLLLFLALAGRGRAAESGERELF